MVHLISNKEFKTEVPILHPETYAYSVYWKEQLNNVRAGLWVSGKWMPGRLYYYVNFHHISMNKGKRSTQKTFSFPDLRDIEWILFRLYEEARGFSGWDSDEEYTSLEEFNNESPDNYDRLRILYPEIYSEVHGRYKAYISAREALNQIHDYNKGIPIYANQAKNFMFMSGRGVGKSMFLSAIILHEWLFKGKPPIHKYMDRDFILQLKDTKTSVIAGAADSKKINETMKKVRDAFSRIPGEYKYSTGKQEKEPAPFTLKYTGNFESEVKANYKEKEGNVWNKNAGSASQIRVISFMDNEFAVQGDRNNLIVMEEVGHFKNLIACYNSMVHNMIQDTTRKFGTMVLTGTGGDAGPGGSTLDAQYMFYNPEAFNLLVHNDEWENRGKIATFLPTWMGLNHHRNDEGIINKEAAQKELNADLEKLKRTLDRNLYEKEVTYKAQVPSEVFLMTDGNIFPLTELKEHLDRLERDNVFNLIEKPVLLKYDQNGLNGISYDILQKGKAQPINMYPWPENFSKEGCPVIYEFPIDEDGKVPDDLYVIGHDPFRTNAENGSLAATIVMKTNRYAHKYGHNEIVAVYYGRPFEGRDASNEVLLKLALFYNAKVMFENNVGNVKDYFEKKKRLDLLYKRPTTVLTNKDANLSSTEYSDYGYPLSNQKYKMEALQYVRTMLLEERGRENINKQIITYDRNGKRRVIEVVESQGEENIKVVRNLDRIYDRRLLQELINYNLDGNFDAVHGFAGCVLAIEESFRKKTISMSMKEMDNQMNFLRDNKKLFNQSSNQMMAIRTMKERYKHTHIEQKTLADVL